jgi:hypothetical protein
MNGPEAPHKCVLEDPKYYQKARINFNIWIRRQGAIADPFKKEYK